MILVFGSSNKGKLEEVSRVVSGYPLTQLMSLDSMKVALGGRKAPEISEPGITYEANAMKKARAYAEWCHQSVIADDAGLEISALGGLPGVYTARFGVRRVREMLKGARLQPAQFVCCICYAEPAGRVVSVTQTLQGNLNLSEMGRNPDSPLPFSHFFTPHGERDNLYDLVHHRGYRSHRGRAVEKLLSSIL